MFRTIGPDRTAIRAAQRAPEDAVIADYLSALAASGPDIPTAKSLGRTIVNHAKSAANSSTIITTLMNSYRLSTEEGVVLMSLAEALLRIPDTATANALIRDKIAGRDWADAKGEGGIIMHLSALGLSLGSATLLLDQMGSTTSPASILRRMIRKSGEPVIRQAAVAAMKMLGQQFVMGENIADAIMRADRQKNELASFDMLGEAARTALDAARYAAAYADAIACLGKSAKPGDPHANHGISIKLSALHPRYEYLQASRRAEELLPIVLDLTRAARAANVPLMIDAEESDRLEPHLDIFAALVESGVADGWPGLGIVVQAYQKRAVSVIAWLAELASARHVRIAVRLVKGAYWDSEIKRAQVLGLVDFPVFTQKRHTDLSYMRCAQMLYANRDSIYAAFASHNAMTIAYVTSLFGEDAEFELQRLHGMGEGAHDALLEYQRPLRPVRVYAPVGTHRDLLAYLVRRLLENGANSSFVHQFADSKISADQLAVDPRESAASVCAAPLPTGAELFLPERRNSLGFDLNDPGVANSLIAAMDMTRNVPRSAMPIIGGKLQTGDPQPVHNPATARVVGTVVESNAAMVDVAMIIAVSAQPAWSLAGGNFRADRLERAADMLEEQTPLFLALAIDEAGKTLADAIAELREAVDFLRYYAVETRRHFEEPTTFVGPTGERNQMLLEGKGVFACISPWNFPLAIFVGQVAAALGAGNAVLAKPAEQTPLIAAAVVELLYQAGVPHEILHFLPGSGEVVGAAMSAHAHVSGIAFTGSTAVARRINRTLAGRDGPIATLIAETGGINAMIVDSTALPEQVARDVVASAFQSAGQRCSALRLLIVQEDVFDTMTTMIAGAMAELVLGNPANVATDIGPIIDAEAALNIDAYIAEAREQGRILAEGNRPGNLADMGNFVAPTIIRIAAISDLKREIFGPVLHVTTYKGPELDAVINAVNATGYGLTLGIHSRIESVAAYLAAHAKVGNIYVNRNQIGAVVGVQPFGGRGLSGTGPKAGGPHYLPRFADEKTVSTDVTAAGGNAALLAH